MTNTTNPQESHRYVSQNVPQWRTCAICGRGANASIHKGAGETKLTAAAKRELIAAHNQGGVALGLCYGPFTQLIEAGLAVQVWPLNAPNGYAVRLTAEGHELAERP